MKQYVKLELVTLVLTPEERFAGSSNCHATQASWDTANCARGTTWSGGNKVQ
ncbi:MAG: hypothetical protein ACM3UZ_02665 [Acidobacteriota bacterium]